MVKHGRPSQTAHSLPLAGVVSQQRLPQRKNVKELRLGQSWNPNSGFTQSALRFRQTYDRSQLFNESLILPLPSSLVYSSVDIFQHICGVFHSTQRTTL
jgi:hypothetical protein